MSENSNYKYTIQYEQSWALASGDSAGGSPFLDIKVKDFQSGESHIAFFERHRKDLFATASNYSVFEPRSSMTTGGTTESGRNYIHMEYLWQPRSGDCLYHVVEHIFRSRFYPERKRGFVITAGVCEGDYWLYEAQRALMLESFEEHE